MSRLPRCPRLPRLPAPPPTLASLLALLLASAAAAAAYPRTLPACTSISSGYLTGVPFYLAMTYLTPGLPDWKISVPVPVECAAPAGHVSGTEALACDLDAAPHVRVLERGVLVRRTGRLQGYATVNITVFCVFPPAPYWPYRPSDVPTVLAPPVSRNNDLNQSSTAVEPVLKPRAIPQRVNESTTSAEVTAELTSSSQEKPSSSRRAERWTPAQLWKRPQQLFERIVRYVQTQAHDAQ